MGGLHLVTGANGHLGNNLVRLLVENGERVKAGVRNISSRKCFDDVKCEIVYADLMNRDSLSKSMKNVETLYMVAAAYKSWALDPHREIVAVNIEGTRNTLEAAATQGVRKIVYVSTTFALDHSRVPMDETGWNHDYSDPYSWSKTEAEKLAWNLAEKHDLRMVSVLPSGMIGPNCHGHLTPTMEVLAKILTNQMPFDPDFNFNLVDIRDVARTMIEVSGKGKNGERYVLAQEYPICSTEIFEFAREWYPGTNVPRKAPYALMYAAATVMEQVSKIRKRKPLMLRSHVKKFFRADYRYTTSKARTELGFSPRPTKESLQEAFEYLAHQT